MPKYQIELESDDVAILRAVVNNELESFSLYMAQGMINALTRILAELRKIDFGMEV